MDCKENVYKLWQTAAIIIATIATILLLTTGIKEGESIGTGLLYTKSPYEERRPKAINVIIDIFSRWLLQ